MASKVVLAYSGGLDTSAIVPWLINEKGCEVVAYAANVGQGDEELLGIEEKAGNSGASSCIVDDLRQELVEDYIWPMLKTGAIYEGTYLLGTSIARPVRWRLRDPRPPARAVARPRRAWRAVRAWTRRAPDAGRRCRRRRCHRG